MHKQCHNILFYFQLQLRLSVCRMNKEIIFFSKTLVIPQTLTQNQRRMVTKIMAVLQEQQRFCYFQMFGICNPKNNKLCKQIEEEITDFPYVQVYMQVSGSYSFVMKKYEKYEHDTLHVKCYKTLDELDQITGPKMKEILQNCSSYFRCQIKNLFPRTDALTLL